MAQKHSYRFVSIFFLFSILLFLGNPGTSYSQDAPFTRGINLTNWFQVSSPTQIQFTKFTRDNLIEIQSLGFDVIRLPINLHHMTGGAPDYTLDTLFLDFLDHVVDWAEELGIHLILDNHTFSPSEDTDPGIGAILLKVWKQMAIHYADRSDLLYYEVLNEPHGISDALWNSIQQDVVDEIRLYDTTHYIVIGPAGWNSYNNLAAMPVYEDDKLIYTFHFYDPFLFTHQGASWVTPSMVDVQDIPFPYDAGTMPSMPSGIEGTWVGSLFNNYATDGTVQKVKALIDIAVNFRQQRGVPIYCGEFGVYQPNSQEGHRTYWYQEVREYLETNQIAWTMWDYVGGFGLFEEGGNDLFDHDLNVPLLEALGLNIPEQTDYIRLPDSTGFIMYDDYLAQSIHEASYTDGLLDYFYADQPNNGDYCIHWTGASQYMAVVFDLKPNRDLTRLVQEGYALDFMVKGNDPGTSFDVRFLDSQTDDPSDVPWRMGTSINAGVVSFDGNWQHVHIPLSNLQEKGGWDGEWHNPQGDYDWSDVDKFELVPEAQALGASHLYFDNIHITNLDTAQVYQDTTTQPVSVIPEDFIQELYLHAYPNPCPGELVISSSAPGPASDLMYFSLWNPQGREVMNGSFAGHTRLDLTPLRNGIYLLQVKNTTEIQARRKIILNKQ